MHVVLLAIFVLSRYSARVEVVDSSQTVWLQYSAKRKHREYSSLSPKFMDDFSKFQGYGSDFRMWNIVFKRIFDLSRYRTDGLGLSSGWLRIRWLHVLTLHIANNCYVSVDTFNCSTNTWGFSTLLCIIYRTPNNRKHFDLHSTRSYGFNQSFMGDLRKKSIHSEA